jgi:hypothetical protein
MAAWEVLQQFATVFDVLNFPPGYEEMLRNCLAVKLAPFYDRPVTADLGQLMTESVMNIQKLNAMTLGAALGETQTLEIPNLAKPIPTGPPQGGPQ